jgi:serine/threonine protein kinase
MANANGARAPSEGSEDPLAGTGYVAVRKLSRGGQADVFLAQHREMGSQCVVKLPHGNMGRADGIERWLQEARILARLVNPHIVRVIHSGRTRSGRPFIALEALEGETLQARLRREGRLSPKLALQIVTGVLCGLEEAHAAGVVHRDLKPDNLFLHRGLTFASADPASSGAGNTSGNSREAPSAALAAEPIVKVLDFGIAKVVRTVQDQDLQPLHLTGKSQVLGTPRYLAPEQIAKDREVDARADLYAVGLILFVALVGEGPFDLFQDVGHLLGAHLQVTPSRVSTQFAQRYAGEQLPYAARFDEILARALRKIPEQRYQSAHEFRLDLESLLEKLIASEPFRPGAHTGKYRLRKLLAQDRTSSVWEAVDPTLTRPAIVKILEPDHVDATVLRRYFERDARVLAGIRHPNVVSIYDFGYERGRPWIAMEAAPGKPLRRLLARGALGSHGQALSLCAQVAAGVWEAHRRGVLHGNLSSANVFVSMQDDSRAVVSDFGTTTTLDQQKGAVNGVLAYQAPEHIFALGDRSSHTPQSDVFSLGVLAYEMLSGRLPFFDAAESSTPEQGLRAQLFEDPVPLHQVDRSIPRYVSALVARCLAKDAAARFPSMQAAEGAFRTALERHAQERHAFTPRVLETRVGALVAGMVVALVLSALVVSVSGTSVFARTHDTQLHDTQLRNTQASSHSAEAAP